MAVPRSSPLRAIWLLPHTRKRPAMETVTRASQAGGDPRTRGERTRLAAGSGIAAGAAVVAAAAGGAAATAARDTVASTSPMKRYPRPGTVSTNTGSSLESRSACRILRIAVLTPVSTSTKTSFPQSRSTICARATSCPRCSTSRMSRSIGCRSSRTARPWRRSSQAPRSSSKSPNRNVSRVSIIVGSGRRLQSHHFTPLCQLPVHKKDRRSPAPLHGQRRSIHRRWPRSGTSPGTKLEDA